jgi:predicted nucleic acid-binding protein
MTAAGCRASTQPTLLPNVAVLNVQPRWDDFKQLCNGKSLKGNAIPDAWIAATVSTANGHLVTFDRDFRKLFKRSQVTIISA